MKKLSLVGLVVMSFLCVNAYAIEFKIFDLRNKIATEAKAIKASITPRSNDVVLLTSMYDSCLLTMSQCDAYFFMMGIFESIQKERLVRSPLDFMGNWLTEIKKICELNVSSLSGLPASIEPKTKAHVATLKGYFSELSVLVDVELGKFMALKKSLTINPQKP